MKEMIGNIYPSKGQNGNVYTPEEIAPAILSGQGDTGRGVGSCNAPKIILLDDYNQNIPKRQDVIGTVTTMCGGGCFRQWYKIIEIWTE